MYDIGIVKYAIYEDVTEFRGIASVQLPDKVQKIITINGSGIGGDVEVPVTGSYDAMTMTMTFRGYSRDVAALREPRIHQIELRVAQQGEDPVSGTMPITSVKHVLRGVPKSSTAGTVAPASSADGTVVFSVRYWAIYIDGVLVEEIDQLSDKNVINGIDYNEAVRKALGK